MEHEHQKPCKEKLVSDMHTAIQAKSIEQESPAWLSRQSTLKACLFTKRRSGAGSVVSSSGLAYKHNNMKLTNINRRAYSLSKKRLNLHS